MKKLASTCIMFMLLFCNALAESSKKPCFTSTVSGSGANVVLLPGLGCPATIYEDLVASLAATHCCHVLQIAGFAGQNLQGSEMDTVWEEAVVNYLQENQLQHSTLLGHSFGGWLALQVAARSPLVEQLIIIDAAPFTAGLFQDISPQQAALQVSGLSSLLLAMSAEQYRAFETQRLTFMVAEPAWRNRILEWLCATPRPLMARLSSAMAGSDLRALLPRIKAKTLVLASWTMGRLFGLDRATVEKRLQAQYQTLPGCTIHLAEKAGHFIMLDEPQWLSREVGSFLAKK